MTRASRTHGRDEKCIQNSVGKPEGERPLGRFRRRWENYIKMNVKKIGCEDVD